MTRRDDEFARLQQGDLRMFTHNIEQSELRRFRLMVDQVQNGSLTFAGDSRVWLGDEISNACGVPVISPRQAGIVIQALLHNGPFALARDDERMKVNLKAIGDRIVVDA